MNILIIGDSLALPRPHRIKSFNPAEEHQLAVHFQETYGMLIQEHLYRSFPEEFSTVTNRAVRSCTLKHILSEWMDHLYIFTPDVVILQVGVVDCWFREELGGAQMVPHDEFVKLLDDLIHMLKLRPNTKVIAVGIALTSNKMEQRYPGILNEIRKYNRTLRSKVDHRQFFYVDMEPFTDPNQQNKYLLPDDSHLNKEGNRLVSQLLLPFIEAQVHARKASRHQENGDWQNAHERLKEAFHLYPADVGIIDALAKTCDIFKDRLTLLQMLTQIKQMRTEEQS